jgi:hypothetical protein
MMEADIGKRHILSALDRLARISVKSGKKFCVAPVRCIHNQFSIMWIDRTKKGVSFALALMLADFGLFPFLRLCIRNGSRIG